MSRHLRSLPRTCVACRVVFTPAERGPVAEHCGAERCRKAVQRDRRKRRDALCDVNGYLYGAPVERLPRRWTDFYGVLDEWAPTLLAELADCAADTALREALGNTAAPMYRHAVVTAAEAGAILAQLRGRADDFLDTAPEPYGDGLAFEGEDAFDAARIGLRSLTASLEELEREPRYDVGSTTGDDGPYGRLTPFDLATWRPRSLRLTVIGDERTAEEAERRRDELRAIYGAAASCPPRLRLRLPRPGAVLPAPRKPWDDSVCSTCWLLRPLAGQCCPAMSQVP